MRPHNSENHFWNGVNKTDSCWVWTRSKSKSGYGKTYYMGKDWRAHRLAYYLTTGQKPQCVCHSCDNRLCCNPSHLFAGTNADNSKDMVLKGRAAKPKGSKHPMSKLTTQQVVNIRRLVQVGFNKKEIALAYGLSSDYVRQLAKRDRWGHV